LGGASKPRLEADPEDLPSAQKTFTARIQSLTAAGSIRAAKVRVFLRFINGLGR
jgi:hypothetical protein